MTASDLHLTIVEVSGTTQKGNGDHLPTDLLHIWLGMRTADSWTWAAEGVIWMSIKPTD